MYYTFDEMELLLRGLENVPIKARLDFFTECLRLRTHERNMWVDAPVAKVFTQPEEWGQLRQRALLHQLKAAILKKKKLDARAMLLRFDADQDRMLTSEELHRCLYFLLLLFE